MELKRLREEQQIFVERVRNLEESKRPPSAGEQDEITEAEEIKQSLAIIASDIETIKKSVANVHRDQPFFKAKPPVPILQ